MIFYNYFLAVFISLLVSVQTIPTSSNQRIDDKARQRAQWNVEIRNRFFTARIDWRDNKHQSMPYRLVLVNDVLEYMKRVTFARQAGGLTISGQLPDDAPVDENYYFMMMGSSKVYSYSQLFSITADPALPHEFRVLPDQQDQVNAADESIQQLEQKGEFGFVRNEGDFGSEFLVNFVAGENVNLPPVDKLMLRLIDDDENGKAYIAAVQAEINQDGLIYEIKGVFPDDTFQDGKNHEVRFALATLSQTLVVSHTFVVYSKSSSSNAAQVDDPITHLENFQNAIIDESGVKSFSEEKRMTLANMLKYYQSVLEGEKTFSGTDVPSLIDLDGPSSGLGASEKGTDDHDPLAEIAAGMTGQSNYAGSQVASSEYAGSSNGAYRPYMGLGDVYAGPTGSSAGYGSQHTGFVYPGATVHYRYNPYGVPMNTGISMTGGPPAQPQAPNEGATGKPFRMSGDELDGLNPLKHESEKFDKPLNKGIAMNEMGKRKSTGSLSETSETSSLRPPVIPEESESIAKSASTPEN